MKQGEERGPNQRQLRIGEEIRHALVRVMGTARFDDPDLSGLSVTITEVKMPPDLKLATVFVTPFAMAGAPDKVIAALNRAAGYFRRELSRMLTLRYTPRINFVLDRSFDQAQKIEKILKDPRIARDIGKRDDEGS
ncbi:MAG TPA: 30S ribosome-binding factor RbfA [Dongiaceae bacterium]|jgi:ribosome-binding factor A|nr:30S ribosome-binding factor RbfA [Dongiaceae bacterium]